MNKRENAIANGDVVYDSGKQCKRGHPSKRYTSTGQCVECLKMAAAATRNLRLLSTIRKNIERANSIEQYVVYCSAKRSDLLDELNDILREDGHRADVLHQFVLMLGSSVLTTADLRQCLHSNDGYKTMLNHGDYPMRNDEDGFLHIQIRGEWYMADDVADCVRGKRDFVRRLTTVPLHSVPVPR